MSKVPTSLSRSDQSGRSDPYDILRQFRSDRLFTSSGQSDKHVITSPTGPTGGTTPRTDNSVHEQRGPTRPSGPSKNSGWMAEATLTVPDCEIANPNSFPHGTSIAGNPSPKQTRLFHWMTGAGSLTGDGTAPRGSYGMRVAGRGRGPMGSELPMSETSEPLINVIRSSTVRATAIEEIAK